MKQKKKKVKVFILHIVIGDDLPALEKVLDKIKELKPDLKWNGQDLKKEGLNIFSQKGKGKAFHGIEFQITEDDKFLIKDGNWGIGEADKGCFAVSCYDFLKQAKRLLTFHEESAIEIN